MKYFLGLLFSLSAYSHPVAYQGAYSFMSINNSEMSENTLIYSPKYWLGLGVKSVQSENEKWNNLHLGFLLKRWNEFNSQANIYAFGGPGIVSIRQEDDSFKDESFMRYGVQADWESREYYTMIKYNGAYSKNETSEEFQARVGFAPFIAGFNDFNLWAILQYQHMPFETEQTRVTPILRMFYKTVLWELGSSLDNNWNLNFMVRF